MNRKIPIKTESGFALLMSLIVVGVLISIGLSVLQLSIKQVQLSTNARDSEIAFHAANAGMECGRYLRRTLANDMEVGNPISPACFGVGPVSNVVAAIPTTDLSGDGEAFLYDYNFTWGSLGDRCTEVSTLVASSTSGGSGLTVENVHTRIDGFTGTDLDCEAGGRCTVISVRGYNKPCTGINNFGTVQREVLLQF